METHSETQRIDHLLPLADALACIDRLVAPVSADTAVPHQAGGLTLAADVTAPHAHPTEARALRDGAALRAEATLDASSYAPVRVEAVAVEVGYELPAGANAVAPPELLEVRGGAFHALGPLAAGDGVLPGEADAAAGDLLCTAGTRLRANHLAVLEALGVSHIAVRASPRVSIVSAQPPPEGVEAAIEGMLIRAVGSGGGFCLAPVANAKGLDAARLQADAIIVIGGSGSGRRDRSVRDLAHHGRVAFHGVGLAPGETAAFGILNKCPVLVVPARLDSALAVWATLGCRMMARLCGRSDDEAWGAAVTLTRKITSTLGLVELVPVAREAGGVAPLASGYLTLQALARSDGYVMVAAESEGFAAGARVEMRPWP